MSMRTTIIKFALGAGLVAMNAVTLGSAAQAYDGRGYGYRDSYRGEYRGDRSWGRTPPSARYYQDDRAERERKKDKALARGLAIGLGAVVLGTILAAEANKNRSYED